MFFCPETVKTDFFTNNIFCVIFVRVLKKYIILLLLAAGVIWPHGVLAASKEIILVQGTTSTPNAAERNYAKSLTMRLSRWMNELSIPHHVIMDEQVSDHSLRDIKLVILGYNPTLLSGELSVLRRFIAGGGKLLVFYSSDPALAKMMKFSLGKYRSAKNEEYWSGFRAIGSTLPNMPPLVRQTSRNIRPVFPTSPAGNVLAYWNNAAGKNSGAPALVKSRHGMWMTHVLLDDGDVAAKKGLLAAMIGNYCPQIWRSVAEKAMRDAAWSRERSASVEKSMRRVAELREKASSLFEAGKYPETVNAAQAVRREQIRAYSLAHSPKSEEICGVWDHTGTGLYPGNWDKTCDLLARYGITDLFVNMLWGGEAHYPSGVLPRSSVFRNYGDQISQCVVAAHKRNIRVHIWKVCWNLGGAPVAFTASLKRQGRLQKSSSGETVNWLCPSSAENVRLEVDSLMEIVNRYAVDGIHLDYIRYKNSHFCCCEGCGKRFRKDTGMNSGRWPKMLKTPKVRKIFDRWRCGRITHLVRELRTKLSQTDPKVKLSAAVFGKYPSCVNSVAQDWVLWLKNGYLDFVSPMNYTGDLKAFDRLVRDQVGLSGAGEKIIPGIGVTATESRLDPASVIDQIMVTRGAGTGGFVLFDLNKTLEIETLPMLSLGITADRARLTEGRKTR